MGRINLRAAIAPRINAGWRDAQRRRNRKQIRTPVDAYRNHLVDGRDDAVVLMLPNQVAATIAIGDANQDGLADVLRCIGGSQFDVSVAIIS